MTLAQPRRYRARIYAPDQEIFTNRTFFVFLTLIPGPTLVLAKRELDGLLYNLAAQDRGGQFDVSGYRLELRDLDTGETFDWPAR